MLDGLFVSPAYSDFMYGPSCLMSMVLEHPGLPIFRALQWCKSLGKYGTGLSAVHAYMLHIYIYTCYRRLGHTEFVRVAAVHMFGDCLASRQLMDLHSDSTWQVEASVSSMRQSSLNNWFDTPESLDSNKAILGKAGLEFTAQPQKGPLVDRQALEPWIGCNRRMTCCCR